MKNYLRYSFVALMAMFMGNVFAQKTVTFDFDNDYQMLFPTLTGVSSGSGDNYVGDGDFKSITMSTPVEGVMVTIAPDEEATNPSRIWTSAPRLRMYSGSFTVVSMVGTPITKIEFTGHDKNFNLSPVEGTLTEKVWTGSSLSPIFMVSKNTQINKIVVTLGEGGTTPDNPDDPDGSIFSKFDFTKGTFTESDTQLVFEFEGLGDTGTGDNVKIPVTGNFTFDFENNLCTTCSASLTFSDEITAMAASIAVQASAEEDGYTDIQLNGNTLSLKSSKEFIGVSKIVIKSMLKMLLDKEQGGYGLLANPLSPNQANIYAGTLKNKEVTEEDIYIKGKIASIEEPFGAQFGNATFYISLDGNADFTFYVYRALYLENQKWVEGNTQLKVGDEVIVCGKLTNYNGTPETAQGKAYIYSLNGKTKNEGGETPDPQIKSLTIAAALDIINGLEDGKTTAEEYEVKGFVVGTPDFQRKADGSLYGNVNFTIAPEKGGTTLLTVFRAKDFENASFTEETINRIKEGDEVVVRGKLQKYVKNGVMTPELTNCYLISVTSAASEGAKVWDFTQWSAATVAALKADAAASKVAGWSDVEKAADAEAGADPTETSKDNCFWSVAEPNADGTLSANGVVIEELKGLVWNKAYAIKRSLAIAVNYPKALSDYAGPAYLWLGGGKNKIPCFTIPGVKAGSTITMEVESHKASDARGVELYTGVDADGLVDAATKIGDSFTPKEKDAHSWTIENDCDVIVYNTNGCHIYKIELTAGATGIQAVKTVKVGNDYIYNLAGQRVDANYKGVVIKNGKKMIQK